MTWFYKTERQYLRLFTDTCIKYLNVDGNARNSVYNITESKILATRGDKHFAQQTTHTLYFKSAKALSEIFLKTFNWNLIR